MLRAAITASVVMVAVCAGAQPASANPFEVLGLTSRQAGQANTGVASTDDAAALYYNPAGLALRPGFELSLGTTFAYAHLTHGGSLPDPFGGQLAMRAPLPLGGPLAKRIVVGVAMHLLPRDVAHVIAPAPDEPYYPYYGDRMSRAVVMPGVGVALGKLTLGASVDVLAGLGGSIAATEGATRAIDARIDQQISTIARALAGATYALTEDVRLGVVYRQRFELPFATSSRTLVAGEPIDLDLRAAGQFTPHQLVAGAAYRRGPLVGALDLRYARWSDYDGPFVRVESRLPLVGDVPALSPQVPFRDTVGARAGIESFRDAWTLRGGYGFETSPVPARQTGVTNLLDGPRHTFALGAGYTWGRFRLDAHVQLHVLHGRSIAKQLDDGMGIYDPFTSLRDEDPDAPDVQITNPGFPGIDSGGQVITGGLTLEVAP